MTIRAGLELGPETIRAVRVAGWPRPAIRVLEVSWDPETPADGLNALREALGPVHRVTVAPSLDLLHVRHLQLPPLPAAEKRRMLSLEPDRYFAVRDDDLVFWVREDDDLVFAVRESLLAGWLPLLESIGRLENIEPAPIALARALSKAQIREGQVVHDGSANGSTLMVLKDGQVQAVRRVFGDGMDAVDASGPEQDRAPVYLYPWNEERAPKFGEVVPPDRLQSVPELAGLDPAFLTAYGAALAPPEAGGGGMVTPALEQKIGWRRRRDRILAGMACAAALVFLLWSVNGYRARAERNLDARIAALRTQASTVLTLQARAENILRETGALAQIEAGRPQPLDVLLAMSQLLPSTAYVRTLRTSGTEWQIDGHAEDAAALIPLFENHPTFGQARFLSGTSRIRVGTETYESFSLALEYTPAP